MRLWLFEREDVLLVRAEQRSNQWAPDLWWPTRTVRQVETHGRTVVMVVEALVVEALEKILREYKLIMDLEEPKILIMVHMVV